MQNVFDPKESTALTQRIEQLQPDTQPEWGKMNVAQMLAHCNVTYEMVYDDKHPKPNAVVRFLLKMFVKNTVINEKPYKRNGQTASQFKIADEKNFATEKQRLIDYIKKTQELGGGHFEGKESHSFGALTEKEWNNMFAKHLEHYLTQFGV